MYPEMVACGLRTYYRIVHIPIIQGPDTRGAILFNSSNSLDIVALAESPLHGGFEAKSPA